MNLRNLLFKIITLLLLSVLSACSGGGGGGGSSGPTSVQMGGSKQGVALSLATSVTTLAGTPPGTAANFNGVYGAVRVGANLYVADSDNNSIRQVVIATGVVTTLAGTAGTSGSTDATGAAARFTDPRAITSDGTDLYVVDTSNSTIRKIVIATGAVTTLAGSAGANGSTDATGAAARFNYPGGITSDGTNLYVTEPFSNTVRKIVIATGAVTTLAGTAGASGSTDATGAAARFNAPYGITNDGVNLYVTDSSNHTVRQIAIGTGAVTTLAGTAGSSGSTDATGPAARFLYPNGLATDGTNLYVADTNNQTIRKIVISTGVVTTLAGTAGAVGTTNSTGAAARFNYPNGITIDGSNLYVADTANHVIRQIVISTGAVTTFAGTLASADGTGAAASFNSPWQITTNGTNLYVADTTSHVIRQIVIATGAVTTVAGSAGVSGSTDATGAAASFNSPTGITTDGINLYVSDGGNHNIRQIVIATGVVTTLAGTTGSSGSVDGTGAAALFATPRSITTDGTNLYVADSYNSNIRKIVIATGVVTTLAGTAGSNGSTDGTGAAALFNYPQGITTDGTNLYVADTDNCTIRKIVISTRVVTTLAGMAGVGCGYADGTGAAARFSQPHGITSDGTNLYVTDWGVHTIRKVVISSGVVTTLAGSVGTLGVVNGTGSGARFWYPEGITTDGVGLYISDNFGETIRAMH